MFARPRYWHQDHPKVGDPTLHSREDDLRTLAFGTNRTIWATANKRETLPLKSFKLLRQWLEMNPGWELRFCDEKERRDMVMQIGEPYISTFDNFSLPVMRADMWRYVALHLYGGVYVDTDLECTMPLEDYLPMREDWAVIGLEGDDAWFAQWILYTPPRHPLYKILLDMIVERNRRSLPDDDMMVHEATGPTIWTMAILDYLYPDGTNLTFAEMVENPQDYLPKRVSQLGKGQGPSAGHADPDCVSEMAGDAHVQARRGRVPRRLRLPSYGEFVLDGGELHQLAGADVEHDPKWGGLHFLR
jgi:hypothetical protein